MARRVKIQVYMHRVKILAQLVHVPLEVVFQPAQILSDGGVEVGKVVGIENDTLHIGLAITHPETETKFEVTPSHAHSFLRLTMTAQMVR
jgi:hypothetical protein